MAKNNKNNVNRVPRSLDGANLTNSNKNLESIGIKPLFYETAKIAGTNTVPNSSSVLYPEYVKGNPIIDAIDPNYKPPSEPSAYLEPQNISRIRYNSDQVINGVRDPRQLFNETPDSPPGIIEVYVNPSTNEFVVEPKTVNEVYKTATISPYGPIRENESTIRRENVNSMYKITEPILSVIGTDATGKTIFSDGNSFVERCIFTGYDKSFMPVKLWKPAQQTRPVEKPLEIQTKDGKIVGRWKDGETSGEPHNLSEDNTTVNVKITTPSEVIVPHVFVSKSGYYYTRRPPIKGMFLGYNDADIVPGSATFWPQPRKGKKHFYNDRICENELHNTIFFADWLTMKPRPKGSVAIGIKSYPMMEKEQVMYSKERKGGNQFETQYSYQNGSYRNLLNSLSKVDIIEYQNIKKRVGPTIKQVSEPRLKRRIEQYGPNPLQHLYYMDYFDWRKYTTTYIPDDEYKLEIISMEKPIESLMGRNPLERNGIYFFNNFLNGGGRGRFDVTQLDDTYFFTDTTYILDIYFGLMEMHLKSFSWNDIMSIVDMIPEFRSPWNDPLWESSSQQEKNNTRFQELDNGLKPIWEMIKQVLDGLSV